MIKTVFFDIGGVLLTNGWDRRHRAATAAEFDLDYEEFQDRHDFVVHDFETGRMGLDEYLIRTVFYRARDFTKDEYRRSMFAHSEELPGALDLLDEIAATGVQLASLNNESRELNEHRIREYRLDDRLSMFLSSCYLGVKKPEKAMYALALQITQRQPQECVFIDDRSLNLECASELGINGVLHTGNAELRAALVKYGLPL